MNTELKTACLRIARAGIKLAESGDIAGGQALVKVADALALGHEPKQVMETFFAKEAHEKVAKIIDDIVAQPSTVAREKQAAAIEYLRASREKQAEAKKAEEVKTAAPQVTPEQWAEFQAFQAYKQAAAKKKADGDAATKK